MTDGSRHGKDLANYLGRHRRQQKQGHASSPSKTREKSSSQELVPQLGKLSVSDVTSPAKTRQASATTSPGGSMGQGKGRGRGRGARAAAMKVALPVRNFKRKATMNDLPSEVLLHLFSFLPPDDLMTCACVNRQWLQLASDNLLWQPLYERFASQQGTKSKTTPLGEKNSSSKPHPVYSLHAEMKWKKTCIKQCIEKRNARIATFLKKKKHPYSLLPANTEKLIQKLGLRWVLVFTDDNRVEHSFFHSDAFHFHTSSSIRWYSLDPPPISSLRCLAVYAQAPVFFLKDGSAADNSPCQRALLLEQRVKPSELTKEPDLKTEAVNIHTMDGGIVIAVWKEGGGIAFVSLCLHHHGILQRATLGTSQRMHIPAAVKPNPDDIDPEYGLHDYTCIMELRNQRNAVWSQQYQRIHANKQEKVEGYVRLSPVRGDVVRDHSYSSRKIQFPWKTDVFKGIIKDFAILDCTVFDEFLQPMWCISSPVTLVPDDRAPVTMEYEGDPFFIKYSDHKGSVDIRALWIPERDQHIVVAVNIDLKVKTVNGWFGTHY